MIKAAGSCLLRTARALFSPQFPRAREYGNTPESHSDHLTDSLVNMGAAYHPSSHHLNVSHSLLPCSVSTRIIQLYTYSSLIAYRFAMPSRSASAQFLGLQQHLHLLRALLSAAKMCRPTVARQHMKPLILQQLLDRLYLLLNAVPIVAPARRAQIQGRQTPGAQKDQNWCKLRSDTITAVGMELPIRLNRSAAPHDAEPLHPAGPRQVIPSEERLVGRKQ